MMRWEQMRTPPDFASLATGAGGARTLKARMVASAAAASATSDCVTGPMPLNSSLTRTCAAPTVGHQAKAFPA